MKLIYAVVFEQTPNNYCAYIPDLPGCIATHQTWEGIQAMVKEAIEFHIEEIQLDYEPVPPPQMSVEQALEYHRSHPNDYGGYYFPVPDDLDHDEDPVAILEVEVEVNLETAPTTTAD